MRIQKGDAADIPERFICYIPFDVLFSVILSPSVLSEIQIPGRIFIVFYPIYLLSLIAFWKRCAISRGRVIAPPTTIAHAPV